MVLSANCLVRKQMQYNSIHDIELWQHTAHNRQTAEYRSEMGLGFGMGYGVRVIKGYLNPENYTI